MGLFGGGNSTSSNTSNAYDQRQIITNTTDNYDLSNRSKNTTNTTNISTDGGAVAGALGVASSALAGMLGTAAGTLNFAGAVVSGDQANQVHAYDYADSLFHSALDAVNQNDARALNAYDRAATIQKDAMAQSGAANQAAFGQLQNAYADAKGTSQSQQQIIMAVIAVAGIALLVAMHKG
jgi:hypothetical protein